MRLINIIAPIDKFDTVANQCIMGQQFHPENAMNFFTGIANLFPFSAQNPYSQLLSQLEQLYRALGEKPGAIQGDEEPIGLEAIEEKTRQLTEQCAELNELRAKCERTVEQNKQILMQIDYFEELDVDLEDLFNLKYVKFRFGRIPREVYFTYKDYFDEKSDVFFFPTSIQKDYVYAIYFTSRADEDQIDGFFGAMYFQRIRISDKVHGSPKNAGQEIQQGIDRAREQMEQANSRIEQIYRENRQLLDSMYYYVKNHQAAYGLRAYAAHAKNRFYMVGWVPEKEVRKLTDKLDQMGGNVEYIIESPKEIPHLSPPVKLKNPWVSKFFEDFVVLYGLPKYNEIDPTMFVTLTYSLFFGIMFGDVGQGAFLIILGFIMSRGFKMTLGRIISVIGVFSIGFGFVYGSIFGKEHMLPGFKVFQSANNITTILLVTVALGAMIMSCAMIFNIINGLKQKNYKKAVYSQNGLAGLVFYWAVIGIVLDNFLLHKGIGNLAYILCLIVLPLIVIFLREPLSKLRKSGGHKEKLSEFLIDNIFEMVEILLSFITNTLSFVRVGAFAISHAGMMMVVMLLAGGETNTNYIALAIGNLFVICLEGLVVGIQVLRLQFYELFGKFYDSGGTPFKPYQNQEEKVTR